MSLVFAIAIYFIVWWLVLFMVLPWGVTTQGEAGKVSPGTVESAPTAPRLWPKLIATTIVATILFAGVYSVIAYEIVTIDDIPFLPRFEAVR